MDILGVRVDNLSKKEILEKTGSFLSDGKFHQIATVNPEFILQAQKDGGFRDILNASALNVADGVGIWFAVIRFGKYLRARMAGADLMEEILRMADEKKLSVFLAINKNGLSLYEEIRVALLKKYPDLKIGGADLDPDMFPYKIQDTRYKILLCNFGAPYQEKFLNSLKNDIIGLGMGVGGSFDFITGKAQRCPKILRFLGLEWLWRLVRQPKRRCRRIFNAVVVFPTRILFKR